MKSVKGTIDRQKGIDEPWREWGIGNWAMVGNAVRTGPRSTAILRSVENDIIRLEENTILRFLREKKGVRLDVTLGGLILEADGDGAAFKTKFGDIKLLASSSANLRVEDGEVTMMVRFGELQLDKEDGAQLTLVPGDSVSMNVVFGDIVLDENSPQSSDSTPIDAGVPDAGTNDAGGEPVSDLFEVVIDGRRAQIYSDGRWRGLSAGSASVQAGTRLRSRPGTTLRVVRGDASAEVGGRAEVVTGGDDQVLLTASRGRLRLVTGGTDASVAVDGGTVRARGRKGGSAATLIVEKSTEVQTKRGTVDIIGVAKGQLSAGETAILDKQGNLEIVGRSPTRVDVAFNANESPTLHTTKSSTAVRVSFADLCPGEGVLEFAQGGSFAEVQKMSAGVGSASVMLRNGNYRYRVRCIGENSEDDRVARTGRLVLSPDSGRRKLPKQSTHNIVESDGRRYTILYQSHLPTLTLEWPHAPKASSFKLVVEPAKGKRIEVSTKKAQHRFKSGELQEGTYTWWFESSVRNSAKTSLLLDFDNAAPVAHFKTSSSNDGIRIEGAVMAGWSVSVHGKEMTLDRHNRFETAATPKSKEDCIPVRIAHRGRGIHYYLLQAR